MIQIFLFVYLGIYYFELDVKFNSYPVFNIDQDYSFSNRVECFCRGGGCGSDIR